MCGIAGLLQPPSGMDIDEAIRRMAGAIRHRGPDDEGYWTDSNRCIGLAHRRLSIIDLSPHGHQPMQSAAGATSSSTTVRSTTSRHCEANWSVPEGATLARPLGHGGSAGGRGGLGDRDSAAPNGGHVRGCFVGSQNRNADARSRPARREAAVLRPTPSGFAFASELKAFDALGRASPAVDAQALTEFMQFGYVPAPRSIYRGLRNYRQVTRCRRTDGSRSAAGLIGSFAATAMKPRRRTCKVQRRGTRGKTPRAIASIRRAPDGCGCPAGGVPLRRCGLELGGGTDAGAEPPARAHVHHWVSREGLRRSAIRQGSGNAPWHGPYGVVCQCGRCRNGDSRPAAIYDEPFADSSQVPTVLVSRADAPPRDRVSVGRRRRRALCGLPSVCHRGCVVGAHASRSAPTARGRRRLASMALLASLGRPRLMLALRVPCRQWPTRPSVGPNACGTHA